MKYALYTGCAAKGACPELYQSTMLVTKRLGIEVVEMLNAACCGAGVITESDPDLALAINARTFAQAEALGLDIMTICGITGLRPKRDCSTESTGFLRRRASGTKAKSR